MEVVGRMQQLNNLYASKCPVCGKPRLRNLSFTSDEWDHILTDIARGLLNGQYDKGTIHPELYKQSAERLTKAMLEGLGGTSFAYDDDRNLYKAYLEQNIYKFSAAKSLYQMVEFRSYMTDEHGNRVQFPEFKAKVIASGAEFNSRYLETEFDTAEMSTIMAQKWHDLTATNDYLEYNTAGDSQVRPAHAKLDGLTLHKDSPVWNRIWPPCDWGCRCGVIPGLASKATSDLVAGALGKSAVTNPLFDNNVGKSKVIFKDDHPYFQNAAGKMVQLDAVNNYGLKSGKQLYANPSAFPLRVELSTINDYEKWWKNELQKVPGTDDVVIKDAVNNHVLFDSAMGKSGNQYNYFKDHILKKSAENRHEYAANFPDIVKAPNEIWTGRENDKLVHYYVKYYQDNAYMVVARDKAGRLTADTMYQLTPDRLKQVRRGILRYSK